MSNEISLLSADPPIHWRLVRVFDVRPIDWATGKRAAVSSVDEDLLPNCHRCEKKHAKVYEITDGRRNLNVGSGCVKKIANGWEPRAEEIKAARAADAAHVKALRAEKVEQFAAPIIATARAARDAHPAPEPLLLPRRDIDARASYGATVTAFPRVLAPRTIRIFVWENGFDSERRGAFLSSWADEIFNRATAGALAEVPEELRSDVKALVVKTLQR